MSRSDQEAKMQKLSNAYCRGLINYDQYRSERTKLIDAAQFSLSLKESSDSNLSRDSSWMASRGVRVVLYLGFVGAAVAAIFISV